MSRSRVLFAVLAMGLLASACTVYELDVDMEGCQDLSVGEQTELKVFRGGETGFTFGNSQWNHQSGPGALEVQQPTLVEYTATEPGSVVITWEAFWHGSMLLFPLSAYSGYPIPLSQTEFSSRCDFEVGAAAVAPAEEGGFEVTAVVTVSTVEGVFPVGAESAAIWRFVFDCPDGRCDVEVHDGGPYGDLAPFMAAYQGDLENFVFDFVLDTPNSATCEDDRWVGEIIPRGWDDQGPVGFTFTMVNELTCDNEDIVVEWEGEGTRG
jgi:hypothetical protein